MTSHIGYNKIVICQCGSICVYLNMIYKNKISHISHNDMNFLLYVLAYAYLNYHSLWMTCHNICIDVFSHQYESLCVL